jgi:hypothetical protein
LWVAAGTHKRHEDTDTVLLRMKDGVADGDLVGDVYHVVVGASSATLDGFTVTRGNANGADPDDDGGGMHNEDLTDVVVANCEFIANAADGFGGAVFNDAVSGLTIVDTAFMDNVAGQRGGGVYNHSYSSPEIRSCLFVRNTAVYQGGEG